MGADGAGATLEGVGIQSADGVGDESKPGDLTRGGKVVCYGRENRRGRLFNKALRPEGFAIFVIPIKETLMEGHIKLPLFHRVNLRSPVVRACYRFLVWIGLGAYPARSNRMEWLDRTFEEYPRHHFFITRRRTIELVKEAGFAIRTLDREYLDALQSKYGPIISLFRFMRLGRFLLSQVGVAIEARKPR